MRQKGLATILLLVIISTFMIGGGIFASQTSKAPKEAPIIPNRKVQTEITNSENFIHSSGLILKNTPASKVQKIEVAVALDAFSIPEDKIIISLFPNPTPEEIYNVADVGYVESSYFSLPGKFNWETSPIYNFLSEACVEKRTCSDNNPVEQLPLERYELTNETNQKVGIVRYIALTNKTTCISCDTVLSFEKRYILDFDSVTIWIGIGEPLLASPPIKFSNKDSHKREVQNFIQNSINKINADKNIEDKFAVSDEFIKQVSVDKNGYAFFRMTDSISNNLCKPCRVEIQGLRMKLIQENRTEFKREVLEPDDIALLKDNPAALQKVIQKFKPVISSVVYNPVSQNLPSFIKVNGDNLFGGVVHFNNIVLRAGGSADDYNIVVDKIPEGNYEIFVDTLFGQSNKLNKKIEF